MTVVTWDSPIPSAEGEQVFIAQVDFDETGTVMADMALNILGDDGGQFAVLSASPDAANQNAWIAAMEEVLQDPKYANLELLDIVYGNDQSEDSYNQALALVDKYPDMELIMAPTTVGIAAAAKAMQDEGLCETVKVSGLGLPAEMASYTLNGCAPEFALWSFVDLGYLSYYTADLLASGQMEAAEGITFEAGRLGAYTIEKDPTRDAGLRVLMGPFTIYNGVERGRPSSRALPRSIAFRHTACSIAWRASDHRVLSSGERSSISSSTSSAYRWLLSSWTAPASNPAGVAGRAAPGVWTSARTTSWSSSSS
jgi:rhamnose transport system substrate-binding protein